MSLAEESDARKARLLALRRKKLGQPDAEIQQDETDTNGAVVRPLRNFDPETRTLRKRNEDDEEMEDTVEKHVAGLAEKIVAEDEQRRAQELDLSNIAPKRQNWDLKRELERKMAKLERKTQEAIHTLIRQRLAAQKGDAEDIVGAMNAQEKAEEDLSDEEEP